MLVRYYKQGVTGGSGSMERGDLLYQTKLLTTPVSNLNPECSCIQPNLTSPVIKKKLSYSVSNLNPEYFCI